MSNITYMRAGIFTTTIEKLEEMGIQETHHFRLVFEPGAVFDFEAGQFANVLVPEAPDHKAVKRPYSIASPPHWKGGFDLCIKKVEGGIATGYLWTLKQGDKLQIQAPLGRFTLKKPLPKTLIFVSTGTGIAPFRSMIHTMLHEGMTDIEIWNIFGNRYDEDILYQKEFEDLAAQYKNFHNIFTVSRPKTWKGEKEYVQFLLKKHFTDSRDKHIYICGLTNMINEVQGVAAEIGFTKDQVFFEKYN